MDRQHGGEAQLAEQLEQFELVPDVEVVRGFVEDQQRCVLDERAGHQHPLALAAGQCGERTLRQVLHADPGHGLPDRRGRGVAEAVANRPPWGMRPISTISWTR